MEVRVKHLLLVCLALIVATPCVHAEEDALLDAMATELGRGMSGLRIDGYDNPYFGAARMTDHARLDISAKLGALFPGRSDKEQVRQLYVELRVGDYDFDNHSNPDFSFNTYMPDFTPSGVGPSEDDPGTVRHAIWLMADARYKESLSTFNRLRGERVYAHEARSMLLGFARVEPIVALEPLPEKKPHDAKRWKETMKAVSSVFLDYPQVFDSAAHFKATRVVERVVTAEGARVRQLNTYFEIHVTGVTRASDGMLIEHGLHQYSRDGEDLPTRDELITRTRELAAQLMALREAPVLQPFTGPAILSPLATGVFFHETIGHRLEGERQNKEFEGKTFKEKVGERILPTFISVYDDPTVASFEGTPLFGHYRYDQEGIPSERTSLIDAGVLEGFLMSRQTIEGATRSNGHGRAAGGTKPMSRMGNLFITSSRSVPMRALKQRLREEARRQGKDYGLIIEQIKGGDTNTSNWGYQAFRGVPSIMWKVDVETGEESLVRGVEIVGTPLISLNRVLATSEESGVFNGHCGAESGYVPVSAIAPATLFEEIELQRSPEKKERGLLLSAPYGPAVR